MKYNKSINEFRLANQLIPGGVNSPVRAFKSVDCSPVFIASAKGSKITDIDGNKYIDFGKECKTHSENFLWDKIIENYKRIL